MRQNYSKLAFIRLMYALCLWSSYSTSPDKMIFLGVSEESNNQMTVLYVAALWTLVRWET
jgi:hypothetical protein